MSLRSAQKQSQSTVPIGVGVLGALVIATGWAVLQGLPFLLGCALTVVFAGCAVALLVAHRVR
jgi:hypothetical protein